MYLVFRSSGEVGGRNATPLKKLFLRRHCRLTGSESPNPGNQDCTIFSNAGRFRMISVDPFSCRSCFLLNSENSRLTVSRVVPIISAISSCVSVSFTCVPLSLLVDFGDHDSSSLANFSDGEVANPSVRISSYAV